MSDIHSTPVVADVVPVSPPRPVRRWSVGAIILIVLLAIGLVMAMGLNIILLSLLGLGLVRTPQVREEYFSHSRTARDKVAIMSLEGLLLDGEGFIKQQIDQVMEDENVKAVVLRVDSPGGTVWAADFILHQLRKMKEKRNIPLVVSMGDIAASGGYYVSMAVGDTPRSIYAEPTTWTGSIGVIIPHYDVTELAQKLGIKEDPIASHPLKSMGSLMRPMTEEERQIFQSLVNDSFQRFKEIVKSGRPIYRQQPELLDKLATGQVYTAQQAKALGLVDEIGFLEDAVERAIALANLDPENVRVVRYKKEPTLADLLWGGTAQVGRQATPLDWRWLLEMAVPRPYYLFWQGPVLLSSRP